MRCFEQVGKRTRLFVRFSTVAGSQGAPGRRARPARLRDQVLHRGRQLGSRRQQHAGLLHPRPHQVPRLHPQPEVRPVHERAGAGQRLGLLLAFARGHPPVHVALRRPRHSRELPPHGRLRLAHLPVGERPGERFWVKFHFKTDQGIRGLTSEEAAGVGGQDNPQLPQGSDLHARSSAASSRRWTLKVQVMPRGRRGELPLQPVRPHQGVALRATTR